MACEAPPRPPATMLHVPHKSAEPLFHRLLSRLRQSSMSEIGSDRHHNTCHHICVKDSHACSVVNACRGISSLFPSPLPPSVEAPAGRRAKHPPRSAWGAECSPWTACPAVACFMRCSRPWAVLRLGRRALPSGARLPARVRDRRRALVLPDEFGEVVGRVLRVGHVHARDLAGLDAVVEASGPDEEEA